jgi:hypothetical protein
VHPPAHPETRTAVTAIVPDVPPIALFATKRERRIGVRRAALLTAVAASIAAIATPLLVGDYPIAGTASLREFAESLREKLRVAATTSTRSTEAPEPTRAEAPEAPHAEAPVPQPETRVPESQYAGDPVAAPPTGESPPASPAPGGGTKSPVVDEATTATDASVGAPSSVTAAKEPSTPPTGLAHAEPSLTAGSRDAASGAAPAAKARSAPNRPPVTKRSANVTAKPPTSAARKGADVPRRGATQLSSVERARAQAATERLVLAATSYPATARTTDGSTAKTPAASVATSPAATSGAATSDAATSLALASSAAPPVGRSGATANTVDVMDPAAGQSDIPTAPPRNAPRERPRNDWRAKVGEFFGVFRNRHGAAAPVEERNARSMASAQTQVEPRLGVAAPAVAVPAVAPPVIPPRNVQPPAEAQASLKMDPPRSGFPAAPAAQDIRWNPAPPGAGPAGAASTRNQPFDLMQHARYLLADTVPRVAAQAEPELARVLHTAAIAQHPAQARLVVDAADVRWSGEGAFIPAADISPGYARRLHNEARRTLAAGRDISDAINVALEAFGANPRDPDIAGHLAFLHLRMKPARPETARQLALHAIVLSGSRRSSRQDEWATLAVASALTGRDGDAVRALFTLLALSDDTDRVCQSALRAYAIYGERMRAPALAILQRIHAQGRGFDYPSCAWPPYLSAGMRGTGAY